MTIDFSKSLKVIEIINAIKLSNFQDKGYSFFLAQNLISIFKIYVIPFFSQNT